MIVVVSEWHAGGDGGGGEEEMCMAGVEAEGGLVWSGPKEPDLKPGCLHCSLGTGTDSGSVQKESDGKKRVLLLLECQT